jgi:hypothetical protein
MVFLSVQYELEKDFQGLTIQLSIDRSRVEIGMSGDSSLDSVSVAGFARSSTVVSSAFSRQLMRSRAGCANSFQLAFESFAGSSLFFFNYCHSP